MALEKWAEALAKRLQEADALSHDDIRKTLADCLTGLFPNRYCYPVDVFGDASGGLVIYNVGDDFFQAPYLITTTDGKRSCSIDTTAAVDVLPRTVYDLETDTVAEAGARNSKKDLALIQTIHDHSAAMGAACKEPDADDKKEAAAIAAGDVRLVESHVSLPKDFNFAEADAVNPLVKIIDAGRGTSGYYTKELLQRDGPKVFTAGTLMYVNHATEAEEAARPEGDWNKLAAVTVGNAYWDDAGRDGPALYAPSKVFSDYAAQVREKAPYTGISIRAGGSRDDKAIAPDGRPGVITKLNRAESIDLVTKAGRGGKLLVEAADAVRLYEAARGSRSQSEGENDMDEAQVNRLIETATAPLLGTITTLTAETTRLTKQLAETERSRVGRAAVEELLEGIKLPKASKAKIAVHLSGSIPITEAGVIDNAKLKESVEKAAKDEAAYLQELGLGRVEGLGASEAPGELKEADVRKDAVDVFTRLTGDKKIAEISAKGRAA